MFSLPKNAKLYRAVEYMDKLLEPHFCQDTWKTGCYFSFNDPFLADSMVLEYNKSLFRGEFETKEEIKCYIGKYAHNKLPEDQQNVNHIDFDIGALTLFDIPNKRYAEVFLTADELSKLELKEVVIVSPEDISVKYSKFIIDSKYTKI